MSLWTKARELSNSPWPKIVTVGVINSGHLLTGKRRDNSLWTSPGGHLNDGEDLMTAARRECLEESGIDLSGIDLHLIQAERLVSHRTGKPFVVFAFIANVNKELTTTAMDPDQEVSEWRWVKIDANSEELMSHNRHAKDDFVLKHLGIQRSVSMAELGRYVVKAVLHFDDGINKGQIQVSADSESEARKVATEQLVSTWKINSSKVEIVNIKRLQQEPQAKGRTAKEVSEEIQSAGFEKNPPAPEPDKPPAPPEPKKLTPEQMNQDPEALVSDEDSEDDIGVGVEAGEQKPEA